MELTYLIYKHTSPSGKSYIGQTSDYVNRSSAHKNMHGRCTYFHNAIKKHGWDNFTHEIILTGLTLNEANYWEDYYIREHNTLVPYGYNLKTGGTNCRISDVTKEKMSRSGRGKIIPIRSRTSLEGYILRYGEEQGTLLYNEHKKKKDSCSLRYYITKYGPEIGQQKYEERNQQKSKQRSKLNIGFKHTDETKQKLREQKLGKKIYRSAEHNAKIGAANRGKTMPKSTCPHCGRVGTTSNMIRWHFDNCKVRPTPE